MSFFVSFQLSLEDFSTTNKNQLKSLDNILKSFSSNFLADVENPINVIEKSSDNITRIDSIDHLIIRPENKIVLIELPLNNDLKDNDQLIGKILNKLNLKQNEKLIVMLTAKRNSYREEETHRISRHILQKSISKLEPIPFEGRLVPFNDCIYLFTNGGRINITVTKSGRDFTLSGELPPEPTTFSGKCPQFNEKDKKSNGKLKLEYDNIEKFGKFDITFSIEISKNWWKVKQISAYIRSDKGLHIDLELDSDLIEAGNDFSFSCGQLTLRDINITNEESLDSTKAVLSYNRFQLQPFKSKSLKVFAESFDCTTFFTIPIWMGLITVLFFVFLLSIGVYCLNQIKTMDRFENPKGKTITVAAAE